MVMIFLCETSDEFGGKVKVAMDSGFGQRNSSVQYCSVGVLTAEGGQSGQDDHEGDYPGTGEICMRSILQTGCYDENHDWTWRPGV